MASSSGDLPRIANFRDIGGRLADGGLRVREGLLYRSVDLGHARGEDVAALRRLGIRMVFDLRTGAERRRSPDRLPAGARAITLDVLADSEQADPSALFALMADPPTASVRLAGGGTHRFYRATYVDMVCLPSARRAYGDLLRALSEARGQPALVHCTTGKDRTGWAVTVLLLLLGVPTPAVVDEYLLSDAAVRAAYEPFADDFASRGGDPSVLEPMMGVHAGYLETAFEAMFERYGSVEGYLGTGLGLDTAARTALRSIFLEPVT